MNVLKKYSNQLVLLFIFILTLLVLNVSINTGVPARDSGVFLYIGKAVLNGKLPYLNTWDHKPPLIYFFDAFGLAIGRSSLWGVWFLEGLSLLATSYLSYKLLHKIYGRIPAVFGTVYLLMWYYFLIGGGNLTEEYALPFQFFTVSLFLKAETQKQEINQYYWWIGLLSAVLFFIKSTSVGIAIGIVFYLLFYCIKKSKLLFGKKLSFLVLGFATICLLLFLYLVGGNNFKNFVDQVFVFNLHYASSGYVNKQSVLIKLFDFFPAISVTLILAYFSILFFIFRKSGLLKVKLRRVIYFLVVFWLPVELFLSVYPGRFYKHYFVSLLPVITILSAQVIFFSDWLLSKVSRNLLARRIVVCLLVILMFLPFSNELENIVRKSYDYRLFTKNLQPRFFRFSNFEEHQDTLNYIKAYSSDSDKILIWGSESAIYVLSNRSAPTKYFYQYPLFSQNYTTSAMIDYFTSSIEDAKPKLIIDASRSTFDPTFDSATVVPPLDSIGRKTWKPEKRVLPYLSEFNKFYKFVNTNYDLVKKTYGGKWYIYKLK